jgi:methionyl aminopeptidase
MTIVKPEDYDKLREAGRINAQILATLREVIRPGMRTIELDEIACGLLHQYGAESAFLNYAFPGGKHPYPGHINVSVNEELVHGIPGKRRLNKGDVVTLDCGTNYQGLIADSAITVTLGPVPDSVKRLIHATEEALEIAIQLVKPGRKLGDISFAIQLTLEKYRVRIPPQFGGHGVGYKLHTSPHISNWGKPNTGDSLEVGMALAIEPMGMLGSPNTKLMRDHWTVVTVDKSVCAHTEHSILVLERGAEVLTRLPR